MIPLKDDNPTQSVPFITAGLVIANVAVFVWELLLPVSVYPNVIATLGVTPLRITQIHPLDARLVLNTGASLFTAMFLHGSIPHVALNMLYLWIFGNNIEDALGHGRFLVFYLLCGLLASFTQVAASPHSKVPMIGASGAISGVLAAYVILFPAARVLTLVFLVVFVRVVSIPAVIVLGVWFLLQLLSAGQLAASGVAVFAHIGGFVSGLVLVAPFRKRRTRQSLF